MMRHAKQGAAALLCCAALALAFAGAGWLRRVYPAFGLRYFQPLTEAQVQRAGETAAKDGVYGLTFWREETGTLARESQRVAAGAVRFYGEGAACYPAEFLRGGYPGAGDAAGCALSSEAAWRLFGSEDVVGQTVEFGEERYTVRGVFRGGEPLALLGAEAQDGFTHVELAGTPAGDARDAALAFALTAGLGAPDQLCYGQSIAGFATACCFLPLLAAAWRLLCAGLRASRRMPPVARQVLWFGLALAFALCLPLALQSLPGWLVPAKWSDFSFWTSLAQTLGERFREWFALRPALKDVQAKQAMLACAAGLVTALWAERKLKEGAVPGTAPSLFF